MSINLQIPEKTTRETANPIKIHYIPATISGTGKANVDRYFDNYTDTSENGLLTNALRGRPLKGCELHVPDGRVGIVFRETRKPMSDQTERNLKFSGQFKTFTYWNYDVNPSDNDALRKTFGTLGILSAVHQKVTDLDDD